MGSNPSAGTKQNFELRIADFEIGRWFLTPYFAELPTVHHCSYNSKSAIRNPKFLARVAQLEEAADLRPAL